MAEREYFSLRYTVPGFVFILIIFGINYSVVLNVIGRQGSVDVFSVSVAILSLFASSAIGFLISQIWFFYFHWKRIYAKILRWDKHDLEESMKKSFGWNKDATPSKLRDEIMGTVVDYILNSTVPKESNLFKFFQRKIDLFHTMSSTLLSIVVGLIFGCGIRFVVGVFGSYQFFTWIDLFLFYFTIISACIFICVLCYLRNEIFFEYHPMLKLFLNKAKKTKDLHEDLHEVYPEYVKKTD